MARAHHYEEPIVALDIGTTKVTCFIAKTADEGALQVLGAGYHQSRGVRNGHIADMSQVEGSVRAAVDAAERMAGVRVNDVCINVTGGGLQCRNIDAEMSSLNRVICQSDVYRLLEQGHQYLRTEEVDSEMIHCTPVGYTVDGVEGIVDPRSMYGERLGVRIHMISVGNTALRNLSTVIDRCHLRIAQRVSGAHASAMACTVHDEKEVGVTVLDMGGGTTSLSVFIEGYPIFADVIPIGGHHVTSDIAKGLSTSIATAERLKTVWGTVHSSMMNSRELLKVPQIGEDDIETDEFPRSDLVRIVRPRIEETFEMARTHLSEAGVLHAAGRRVVLTGGASQLQGVRETAELILDKQVRLGRPRRIRGVPEPVLGPAFSACAGLLHYAKKGSLRDKDTPSLDASSLMGKTSRDMRPWGRFFGWLKENL